MRKLTAHLLVVMLLPAPLVVRGESYATLDKKIVKAYNASPKRTRDVYRYAMQILEKSEHDRSRRGRHWRDKARRLITIVCYVEADRAIENQNERQVYLWAMRGVKNGAARGELAGISIKQVYELLNDLVKRLDGTVAVEEMPYGGKMLAIKDYHHVGKDNLVFSRDKRNFAGQLIEKRHSYTLLEGPKEDASGNIYVKISTGFGRIVVIQYDSKRGWHNVVPTTGEAVAYYPSWQSCAAANSTLKPAGNTVTAVRNCHIEQKIYYVPKKLPTAFKSHHARHRTGGDE